MSCCGSSGAVERFPGTGCCGSNCTADTIGCTSPRIRSCLCQENVGCLDRSDCGGFRPSGTAATGACPGPCQCAEEEAWNTNVPPKPNCEWLSNFEELRRQWSEHARRGNCKCCNCPRKTVVQCRPCLPVTPHCSSTSLSPSDCQDWSDEGRLAGGASEKPEESLPETENSAEPPVKRESGGGCPPPSCPRHCSTYSSSACPQSHSADFPAGSKACQPCGPTPKPILKKRNCCQCSPSGCICQPVPRNCNCPPPVQVDVRADRECTCDCPSAPECACPPSERRFPRTIVRCPNARLCCPVPRLPPGPKCRCSKCQPCLPPPCDPCTSNKCQIILPKSKPCVAESPCCSSSPCRDRPPCNSCCKPCPEQNVETCQSCRMNRPLSSCGQSSDTTVAYVQTSGGWGNGSAYGMFSYVGSIGHSILVPGPLALLSFVLLILLAVGLASSFALHRRYSFPNNICFKYSNK